MRLCLVACLLVFGCSARATPLAAVGEPAVARATAEEGCVRLEGARRPGGDALELVISDGRWVEPSAGEPCRTVPAQGVFVAPGVIDAHVHLAYYPVGQELASNGVVAVLDLAAPMGAFDSPEGGLRVLRSGPMITAPLGYPTQSWGRGGYGLECADVEACVAAVDAVIDAGAVVVKVPLTGHRELDDASLSAVIERAHERGVRVAVHALSESAAARGARFGADLLAHTPTEALTDATVEAWAEGAVVSTLRAFGGRPETLSNLRRLRAAGCLVLYGTDLGNTREAGVDAVEIELLADAGMDPAAILEAMTQAPARWLGLDDLGSIAAGREASALLLDADPTLDASAMSHPVEVLSVRP